MTRREFQDRVKHYERARGFSFSDSIEFALKEAIEEERQRCLKIIHEWFVNYRGASIQTAFPEAAKVRLADTAKAIEEIEKEIRQS